MDIDADPFLLKFQFHIFQQKSNSFVCLNKIISTSFEPAPLSENLTYTLETLPSANSIWVTIPVWPLIRRSFMCVLIVNITFAPNLSNFT